MAYFSNSGDGALVIKGKHKGIVHKIDGKRKNRFHARIISDGKTYYSKMVRTEKQAIQEYKRLSLKYHGVNSRYASP